MSRQVLIVEDDMTVARYLKKVCDEAGYHAVRAADGRAGLEMARRGCFDLILLDVLLPGCNGLEVCRRLREDQLKTPILMLTACDSLEDVVAGLDAGADDYIVKPFDMQELLARMRALHRRYAHRSENLRVEDLVLETSSRLARRGSKTIFLSDTEYALLEFLMSRPNQTIPRLEILMHVWQYDFGGAGSVLDVYMMYLRNKIDKGFPDRLLHTVRGVGFRLGRLD